MARYVKKTYRQCWVENHVCQIPLSNGKVAICDEDRFEEVKNHLWSVTRQGYPRTCVNKKSIYLTKFLYPDFKSIDHINRNTLDNRSCNLREANKSQNAVNTPPSKSNKSGFKGVYRCELHKTKKWVSKTMFQNKHVWIGYFETPEEAARAYDKKAKELFGEFAYLNFSNEVEL